MICALQLNKVAIFKKPILVEGNLLVSTTLMFFSFFDFSVSCIVNFGTIFFSLENRPLNLVFRIYINIYAN